MPQIVFDSEFVKAGVNITDGDKIRFLDAGEKDKQDRWIFLVEIISGKTGKVRAEKKFSLNKTNFLAISSFHGSNSDDWVGKEVEVHVVFVQDPSGKSVKGVRVIGKENVMDDLDDGKMDENDPNEIKSEDIPF